MGEGIVEKEQTRIEQIEEITPDKTVGICEVDTNQPCEAPAGFDPRRIRRALLAFEDEWPTADRVHVDVKERTDGNGHVLVLQPQPSTHTTLGLASLVDGGEA